MPNTLHPIKAIRSFREARNGSSPTVNFVYDVEAVEIVLLMNSFAWAKYFSAPLAEMMHVQFYVAMNNYIAAPYWYTGALLLLVLQTVTLVFRSYALRRSLFAIYALATLFAQWAIWNIPLVVLNEYQNLGIAIACIYAFARLAIRHRTVRVA